MTNWGQIFMMLYKYLAADRVDVLQNCMVRYTQSGAFNDPFEVKPHVSKLSEESDAYALFNEKMPEALREEYNKLPRDLKSQVPFDVFLKLAQEQLGGNTKALFYQMVEDNAPMVRQLVDDFNKLIGIFSLTEKPDNLLMWAHYASSYEGYVIGFDATHPYFHQQKTNSDEFGHIRKVEYRQNRPSLPLIEMTGVDNFLVKSTQWSYEQEWRILRPLQDANKIIDFPEFPVHLFSIPPTAFTEVILGCRMKEAKREEIITTVKNTPHFQHIRLIQSEVDEREFKLDFSDII